MYFGKNVEELDLAQCASLIGITNNPSIYDPYLNPEKNKERQEIIPVSYTHLADDLLGPWYNKRWIGFRCIRPYDAVSASRELLTFAEDGFRFMIPYYQFFDQIYRMAD